MSCNYADGLSPYENKGILGVPEKFDTVAALNKKCDLLAQLISQSKHVVVHTGAGISTAAGIPDFRGPNGVWTLEKQGKRPTINMSFADAKPTKTHMILKKLVECNKVHFVVSQNIDGLHLKSGLSRKYLAELHGNMFVDECQLCKRQFVRSRPVETVGRKCSGVPCGAEHVGGRPCRGRLYDNVLDWEHSLPDNDLLMAEWHSSIADLSICLGTTLQIRPSGNLPLETAKYGGKLVICNLQSTKHDNKADLIINYYVDDILEIVMNKLGLDIPIYNETDSPTILAEHSIIDWTIDKKALLVLEKLYKKKCKGVKKKRILIKNKRNYDDEENYTKAKVVKTNEDTTTVKIENGDEKIKEKKDGNEQKICGDRIKEENGDVKNKNEQNMENVNTNGNTDDISECQNISNDKNDKSKDIKTELE